MEFVDRRTLVVPAAWLKYADEGVAKLVTDRGDRKKLVAKLWINKKQARTRFAELKRALAELSGDRCWYCETLRRRSRHHIDHFRPKSVAKNRDGSVRLADGYWWLALDYRNFRVACELCNTPSKDEPDGVSRGKAEFFPLFDEHRLARADLQDERPLLLDPCVEEEPRLLDFEPSSGRPVPARGAMPEERERVEVTVQRLNLDATGLCTFRKQTTGAAESAVTMWTALSRAIELAQEQVQAVLQPQRAEQVAVLRRLIAPGAEYRSIVHCYLQTRLAHSPELRALVFDGTKPGPTET